MNKAVFLDRDGVINAMIYNQEHGTVDSPSNPEQFELLPGTGEAIRLINEMRMPVLIVSNQPGVAKGKFTTKILAAINRKLETNLAKYKAQLDGIYYCLHHPDSVLEEYRCDCSCRKPKPGLLLKGGKYFNVDLSQSYIIGDSLTDVKAGKAAGCKTILLGRLKCDLCKVMEDIGARPDFIVSDLLDAVKLIKIMEVNNADIHRLSKRIRDQKVVRIRYC